MATPEVRQRHRLALMAFLFLVTSCFGFLQPFAPIYLETSGLTREQIGWVFGLGTGIALLLQPVWGRLSDRIDSRRPFIIGSAVAAGLAYLGYRQATGFPAFLALTALGANGTLYLNTVGGVLVGRLVSSERGGGAYASYRVWGSIGYVVVTLLTGLLLNPRAQNLDRPVLDQVFTFGPLLFFGVAAVSLLLPDFKRGRADEGRESAALPVNLKWFLLSYFLYVFALYGASNFLALYMQELGGSPLWITAMFAGGVVCEVLVMRVSGRFSDRYGRRPLLALTYLLLPIRLLMYVAATAPLGVFMVQLLHGVNFGIMGALAIVLINDLASDGNRGQAQARLATSAGLASTVSPIVFGFVARHYSLHAMFIVAATLGLGAFLVFLFKVHETHPDSRSIADRVGGRLGGRLRWLDEPPRRL